MPGRQDMAANAHLFDRKAAIFNRQTARGRNAGRDAAMRDSVTCGGFLRRRF